MRAFSAGAPHSRTSTRRQSAADDPSPATPGKRDGVRQMPVAIGAAGDSQLAGRARRPLAEPDLAGTELLGCGPDRARLQVAVPAGAQPRGPGYFRCAIWIRFPQV